MISQIKRIHKYSAEVLSSVPEGKKAVMYS